MLFKTLKHRLLQNEMIWGVKPAFSHNHWALICKRPPKIKLHFIALVYTVNYKYK